MKAKALQEHFNSWMLLYVVLAIAAGLVAGVESTAWIGTHQSGVSKLTTLAVFLIIYPMMVNLRLEALLQAGKNVKGLLLATAFNFIWAPVLGLALARVFLPNQLLALVFLLVMVVPCSSMAIGYTGLSKGNTELATVVVALSFLLAVIAVPLWMAVFAGRYHVALPLRGMLWTIVEVLIAPMILGYLTRAGVVRWAGPKRFQALQPLFPALSLLAMYGIIFTIFFSKAAMIVTHWAMVLLLLVPNGLFIAVTLAAVTWLNRRLGLSYEDNMAVVFASTGKNNGTAIAIATTAFSPLVAVPAATMPIFQILLMVLYLRSAERIRRWFVARRSTAAAVAA